MAVKNGRDAIASPGADRGKVDVAWVHHDSGGRVARVTIDDEARLNALSTAQVRRLAAVFREIARDQQLAAVVLTGAGSRAFIGGADLNELGAFCQDSARAFISHLHQACRAIRDCPVPVIARINGWCLGAGLEIAASCDMRVAADHAMLGMPEVRMGIPSVIEAALLPGLIGWGRTRWLLLTGENVRASDALAMGLVERVAPAGDLDAAVGKWLDAIAGNGPKAVRAQKALISRWERCSLEEGVMAGIDALADAYTTGEPRDRIAAHFEARRAAKALEEDMRKRQESREPHRLEKPL